MIGRLAVCSRGRVGRIEGRTELEWGESWIGTGLDGKPWASRDPSIVINIHEVVSVLNLILHLDSNVIHRLVNTRIRVNEDLLTQGPEHLTVRPIGQDSCLGLIGLLNALVGTSNDRIAAVTNADERISQFVVTTRTPIVVEADCA